MDYLPELEWTQSHSELRNLLASFFSEQDDIRRIVDQSGMLSHNINFSGNSQAVWHNIIHAALRTDSLTKLYETAEKEYPSSLFQRFTKNEAKLVVISGSQVGRNYSLNKLKALVIGRSSSADIVCSSSADIEIDDRWVSRSHACILYRDRGFYIRDLGSKNGSFLNDEKVTELHLLLPGSILRVGQTYLCYSDPDITSDLPTYSSEDTPTPLLGQRAIIKKPHLNISQLLEHSKCFQVLLEALDRASLLSFLSTTSNISLFAPTDDSCFTLPNFSTKGLRATLNIHILNEQLLLTNFGDSILRETMQPGAYIRLNKDNSKRVFINKTRIVARDIPAANGVVHIVDSWLRPTLIK